jgi:hypothetical protein
MAHIPALAPMAMIPALNAALLSTSRVARPCASIAAA